MLKVEDTGVPVEFSPALIKQFDDIVSRYPKGKQKSGLLPILHLVQAEFGWVSPAAMDKVAEYRNTTLKCMKWLLFTVCTFAYSVGNMY